MGDVVKLRQERGTKVDKMEEILAQAGDADLTEDQSKEFDALKKDIDSLDARIGRAEEVQRLKAARAVPADPNSKDNGQSVTAPAEKKGVTVARMARALAAAKGIPQVAAMVASQSFGENHPATKALAASSGSSGGFLVPEQYSAEIVELLRASAVVRQAGARVMPMSGTLLVPKITTGSSAAYVGENQNITKTEPKFGQIRLTARKLAAVVPISNDLLRTSNPAADDVVLGDLVAGLANTEDAAFIREDGTGNAPKGMYHWANAGNRTNSAGTALANIETDIRTAIGKLINNNVRMVSPAWLMAPRSRAELEWIRDASGNKAFPEVGERNQLRGYPIYPTNNIPINLGAGSNATEMYFVDMADAVIGEEMGILLDVSDTAAYHDGTNVVAAFSQDQTVIRAIMKHDFAMRHDRSVAVIEAITWGA